MKVLVHCLYTVYLKWNVIARRVTAAMAPRQMMQMPLISAISRSLLRAAWLQLIDADIWWSKTRPFGCECRLAEVHISSTSLKASGCCVIFPKDLGVKFECRSNKNWRNLILCIWCDWQKRMNHWTKHDHFCFFDFTMLLLVWFNRWFFVGTVGSYSHFLVYTKSTLVEQTTPVFLTLEEARNCCHPKRSTMDFTSTQKWNDFVVFTFKRNVKKHQQNANKMPTNNLDWFHRFTPSFGSPPTWKTFAPKSSASSGESPFRGAKLDAHGLRLRRGEADEKSSHFLWENL